MNTASIVVGVDESEGGDLALQWAIAEAKTRGAPLRAVHAYRIPVPALIGSEGVATSQLEALEAAAIHGAEQTLDRVLGAVDLDGVQVDRVVAEGPIVDVILRAATDAALVVTGARGLGQIRELALGSVSQALAQHANCPTVIVPKTASAWPIARIVVGVDGSSCSIAALRWAAAEARLWSARLDLVVGTGQPTETTATPSLADKWTHEMFESELRRHAAGVPDTAQVDVGFVVNNHRPVDALLDASVDADLVVLGARGLGAFRGMLLGSVSHRFLHHTMTPTVIVRED